jgi:starch-binding outer membrane protein, SusD/RagB family
MKKIFKYALTATLIIGLSSCNSYFDVDLEQNIPSENAYKSAQDVQNGMIGAYYALGTYRFYGRNVLAIGDMASDVASADASSGHYVSINQYTISDTEGDILDTWDYGYKLIDRCVRTIQGAEAIESKATELKLSGSDLNKIKSCKSQCYALRALTTFTMTNLWGLPYQPGKTNSQLGICLLDKAPLEAFKKIERSTVEQCYSQVLSDIKLAKDFYNGEDIMNGSPQFYFNEAAIYALEARVNLYMGKYKEAEAAAKKAIDLRASGDVSNEMYVNMWNSTSITNEDILTIAKSDDDNLSANALNTLYGSYGGTIAKTATSLFKSTDSRKAILDIKAYKFCGTSTSQATSNIPVFRKSEMYLIIAECEARLADGTLENAQNALLYTAKRDASIKTIADLPQTKAELLTFIAKERVRELFQEGHRWFDIRRTGEVISTANYSKFDASKFVYPVPADEINAGFCTQQNDGWEDALPQ